jgi:hypothetical protein
MKPSRTPADDICGASMNCVMALTRLDHKDSASAFACVLRALDMLADARDALADELPASKADPADGAPA